MPTNYEQMGGGAKTVTWNDKNLKPGSVVEGRYVEKKTNVGPNKSNLYVLEDQDGTLVGVWGGTVVDGKFNDITIGKMVKIQFDGIQTGKTGKNFKAYTFWKGDYTGTDEGRVYGSIKSQPKESKVEPGFEEPPINIDEETTDESNPLF